MGIGQPVEVICTPQQPHWKTSLIQILSALGYVRVSPERSSADLVIAWEDTTLRAPSPYPVSRWGLPPINGRCLDISKAHLDAVFTKVFGYSLSVDPTSFRGKCIQKSNMNARHDARLLNCPVASPVPGRVYQHFIDSLQPNGVYEDMRIAVVGNELPLGWRRITSADALPEKLRQHYDRSIPVPTASLLSPDEMTMLLGLCDELGLDFAEVEAARDWSDGRLYVFDANSTPYVRNRSSTEDEKALAIELLAAAFARQFQPVISFHSAE
jgi:hypothetical protein